MAKRVFLVSLMLILSWQSTIAIEAKESLPAKTDTFLDKLKGEEVSIKLKDGKKHKGIFRELHDNLVVIETKQKEIVEIELNSIKKIKKTRDGGSVAGGVLVGVLAGTGLFLGVLLMLMYSSGY